MADQKLTAEALVNDSQPTDQPASKKLSRAQIYWLIRRQQKKRLGVIPQGM